MSRFFSSKYATLEKYTPGEQPKTRQFIKLNTNESPFPPSDAVLQAVGEEAGRLQLYSDPTCYDCTKAVADYLGVKDTQVLMTNGSDEILNFAFMAYGDDAHPFAFPAISYGFYPVFGAVNNIPCKAIPLDENLNIRPEDYFGLHCNIVFANPNAPTGLFMEVSDIEKILQTNPDNIVIVDEAYIDFGGQTCLPLLEKYENLLITRTFSKSFSLAGARLGFGVASEDIIADLNTIKYSTNPYNVNRMTMAAGKAAMDTAEYYENNCQTIMQNRAFTKAGLEAMGFCVLDSKANFLFAQKDGMDGERLYLSLKDAGILVRHFGNPIIKEYIRITIGSMEQMEAFLQATKTILQKEGNL